MGFIYLLSYLIDPYILVFRFRPYNKENMRIMSDLCNFIILIDILVIPIMGTKKEDDQAGIDDEEPPEKDEEVTNASGSTKKKKKRRKGNVKMIESADKDG